MQKKTRWCIGALIIVSAILIGFTSLRSLNNSNKYDERGIRSERDASADVTDSKVETPEEDDTAEHEATSTPAVTTQPKETNKQEEETDQQEGEEPLEENNQPEETPEQQEITALPEVSTLDSRLPAVVYLHIDDASPEKPIIVLEERASEKDVMVDISTAMDSNLKYPVSPELEQCIERIVHVEAGNQPFIGKLLVAEGVVNRLRSGVYGPDVAATLKLGYYVQTDSEGNFHVYHSYGQGAEVLSVSEEETTVTKLALQGSTISNVLLKAAMEVRNEQYGLELGEECYRYGSIYHYAPKLVTQSALNARTINRVPVSIQVKDHVFYGYWLNKKYAMHIV